LKLVEPLHEELRTCVGRVGDERHAFAVRRHRGIRLGSELAELEPWRRQHTQARDRRRRGTVAIQQTSRSERQGDQRYRRDRKV
jgi:hypothetical protein